MAERCPNSRCPPGTLTPIGGLASKRARKAVPLHRCTSCGIECARWAQ